MVLKVPLKYVGFITALVLFNWGQGIIIHFLNDDFQIIGSSVPGTMGQIFLPFFTEHVWGVYWRPLIKIAYNSMLFVSGMNPMLFHSFGLLLFVISSLLVYILAERISGKSTTALIAASLFVVLPSRELPALWIADQVELLVFIFIGLTYLTTDDYLKNGGRRPLGLAFIFITGAFLSKELSFVLILLPLLIWASVGFTAAWKGRLLNITVGFIALFVVFILYRLLIIGSNPFAAEHLSGVTLTGIFKNLALYIPSVFAGPDILENLYHLTGGGKLVLLIMALLAAGLLWKMINAIVKDKVNQSVYLLGLGWSLLFLLPVLPVYMRWYVFTASFGIILIVAHFLTRMVDRVVNPQKILIPGLIILFVFSMYNFFVASQWVDASRMMDKIGVNIYKNREYVKDYELVLWGVPDKINRIPVMKLGQKEIFEYFSTEKPAGIFCPLRVELVGDEPLIQLLEADSAGFSLIAYGGRFLPEGSRSRAVLADEEQFNKGEEYSFSINTKITSGYPVSVVTVQKVNLKPEQIYLWFTGKEFRRIGEKSE